MRLKQLADMKRTIYTRNNVTLKQDKGKGWWLCIGNKADAGWQEIAIEESEIEDITDTCIEMLIDWQKAPKGIKKAIAKCMTPEEKVAWDMYFAAAMTTCIAHFTNQEVTNETVLGTAIGVADAMLIERRKRHEN